MSVAPPSTTVTTIAPTTSTATASTASTATASTASAAPVTAGTQSAPLQKELVEYRPHRSICCTLYKDKSNFQNVLQSLELTDVQKEILKIRYLAILENFKRRSRNYSAFFFLGHTIITVGSLFVPALLSIQNSDKSILLSSDNFNVHVYWATFVISLLVTIFNGLLTLFKVDKKYYFLNTTLERLRSEGWQYFSLTGRYSGHLINHQTPTHANQFVHFTHYIEKIKMKQVEEEYFKADEKAPHAPTNSIGSSNIPHTTGNPEIYPLSPDKAVNDMKNATNGIPGPVERAMNSLIKSQRTVDTTKKSENEIIVPDGAKASPLPTPLNHPRRSSIIRPNSVDDSADVII